MGPVVTPELWRHRKSGGVYRIIVRTAILEADATTRFVIYTAEDGKGPTWARPYAEFFDGRFVREDAARSAPAVIARLRANHLNQDYRMLEEAANALESAAVARAAPREPTEAMITAGYQAIGAKLYPAACKALWIAMYDKRPKAERGMG